METLNDLIKKYPKIFKLMDQFYYRISSGVPEAWLPELDKLCWNIQDHINSHNRNEKNDNKIPQLVCQQVKEKFGELRFYYYGGDEQCDKMVKKAEDALWNTCEICGSHKNIQTTKGWIQRLCENCLSEMKNTEK